MVYLFLAEGFEEIEALTPVDILRRGGVAVTTVGVGGKQICGSHGITVTADMDIAELTDCSNMTAVVLPGGMPGTRNLEKDETVIRMVKTCCDQGGLVGAICAAPSILGHLGLVQGKKATAFPGFESELAGAEFRNGFVETDDNIITARGMGVATDFGLALLAWLKGEDAARKVKDAIQCRM